MHAQTSVKPKLRAPATTVEPILEVENLEVRFATRDGVAQAVNGVSFYIGAGETLGVVGESGSGKSQTFMAMMGLLAANGRVTGSAKYHGKEILNLPPKKLDKIRGGKIAMIFQDPMTSLNPYLKISTQMTEVLRRHLGMSKTEARNRSIEVLEMVRIPEARKRFDQYPHEFSGGMRQRVMIAMSLLCRPDLLIADEPTTALDVTVQAQILDLLGELKREVNAAIAFITHDLGVVAGLCDRVMVMYAGRIAEDGTAQEVFFDPQHPYTEGLLKSTPRVDEQVHEKLPTIPGRPPDLLRIPKGCPFSPRCPYVFDRCLVERPALVEFSPGRRKTCHLENLQEGHRRLARGETEALVVQEIES